MLESLQLLENSKIPSFIKEADIFNRVKKFEKIFPRIGLPNSKITLSEVNYDRKFWFFNLYSNLQLEKYSLLQSLKNEVTVAPLYLLQSILGAPAMAAIHIDFPWTTARSLKSMDNCKLCFASDDFDGAWDILTMSMRGISSCQSWTDYINGHCKKLVGSIVDPFCGVIYITNDKPTKYGSQMLYRAIVRYTIHQKFGPCLFLENLYNNVIVQKRVPSSLYNIFAAFLHNKTGMKVIYPNTTFTTFSSITRNTKIPTFRNFNKLTSYEISYRDSGIQYERCPDEYRNLRPLSKFV